MHSVDSVHQLHAFLYQETSVYLLYTYVLDGMGGEEVTEVLGQE